jgi:glycosyltransferase involved in cell wall biosynthesis
MERPVISVVLPVRNGAATIDDQLAPLARQNTLEPWELVLVDNGSSDETLERVRAWQLRLPGLRVVEGPSQPSQAAALNVGVATARGERLAFCDADDVVSDGWVRAMCDALGDHGHVTGPLELGRLNPAELVWGDHVAGWLAGPPQHAFLPFAMGCNVGWRREVFDALGGLDERLPSAQDRDLSWRAQLAGYGLWFAEGAVVHRRQRRSALTAARQHVRSGRNETILAARFGPYGLRRRPRLAAARAWVELVARVPWLLRPSRRMRWAETAGLQLGRAVPLTRAQSRAVRLPG